MSWRTLYETFHAESHYAHVPIDHDVSDNVYRVAKENKNGRMFFRELIVDGEIVGVFIGSIVPIFFSKETQAQDLIFYVLPEHRGSRWFIRTLKEFEQWAKDMGAFQVVLYTDTGINPEKLGKLLTTFKYNQTGLCYNKEI